MSSTPAHRKTIARELASMSREDTVHIRLGSADDFYNGYDPAPPSERALSSELEAYLLERLEHLSRTSRLQIVLAVPRTEARHGNELKAAFKKHFKTRAEQQIIANTRENQHWLKALLFGIAFLGLCLVSAHFFNRLAERTAFMHVLGEGFSIIGWVALWEPAGYFLYYNRDRRTLLARYMRLCRAEVSVAEDV